MPRLLPILLLAGLLGACAAPGGAPPGSPGAPWRSEEGRDHPLAGKIWMPGEGRFVTPEALLAALGEARFAVLGEVHDNWDHHRIQAWLTARLMAGDRAPALAFEMITTAEKAALDAYLATHPRDAAGLGPAVKWTARGWPDWAMYAPIAQAALDAGAPIVGADMSRPRVRAIIKEGVAALGAARVRALGLDKPLPRALAQRLRWEIVESHCDQLPASMIDPMATAMGARDAYMADAVRAAARLPGRDGAILITGAGHARADHGVPYRLGILAPEGRALGLAMVEVDPDETDPGANAARFNAPTLPYDYVWFTPRAARAEPCERFADQLRRAKERHLREREKSDD